MAEVITGWDKAVSSAEKVLGDDAKIPQPKPTIDKAMQAEDKAFTEFDKSRSALEDQILGLVDASNAVIDAVEQFRDVIADEDFKLDSKSDAKKIAAAKKILLASLDSRIKVFKENAKNERDLNKHLAHIRTYKQGK